MMNLNREAPERQDIEALLPWHAAGTLSRRDSDRVEQALASDRDLARRYELVREELNETIHLNESLGAPSARAMEKLFAAIDAEGARSPRRVSFDLAARFSEFLSSLAPRTLAWSASAAAVAIVLVASAVTTAVVSDRGPAEGIKMASAGDGTQAAIRFVPQANAGDITTFMEAYKVVFVDGPKRGLYTIRFTDTSTPKEDIVKVIKRMQTESKIVEFVAAKD